MHMFQHDITYSRITLTADFIEYTVGINGVVIDNHPRLVILHICYN